MKYIITFCLLLGLGLFATFPKASEMKIEYTPSSSLNLDVNALSNGVKFTADLELDNTTSGQVIAYNLLGKAVKTWNFGSMEAGTQELSIDANQLPNGVYLLKFQFGNQSVTKKIQVKRLVA